MNTRWIDKAEEEIERDYAEGRIDYGQYHNAMRELRREIEDAAREAAQDAYDDYRERR